MSTLTKWKVATLVLAAIVLGMVAQPIVSAWVADNQRQEIEQVKIDARLAVECTDKTNEPGMCLRLNKLEVGE